MNTQEFNEEIAQCSGWVSAVKMEMSKVVVGQQELVNRLILSLLCKGHVLLEGDLVFDVRFMPNPFYIENLRAQTGLDRDVADYVFSFQQAKDFVKHLENLLAFSLPLYAEEGKTNLVIAVGCTGGHHRSVAVTHALAEFVRQLGYPVTESHRDISHG